MGCNHSSDIIKSKNQQNMARGCNESSDIISKNQQKNDMISVYSVIDEPSKAWDKLRIENNCKCLSVDVKTLSAILPEKSFMRFVCISDTHNKLHDILDRIPDGDVLIHAGDFTGSGTINELKKFNDALSKLPHQYKIVVAGNHDICLDKKYHKTTDVIASDVLTNCIYLENSEATINGIRIYGSPFTPAYYNWAFQLNRGQEILNIWNLIPAGIDILITHGPCVGHGDLTRVGQRAGCVELLLTIEKRVKPKYHIFGHIHEGYGVTTNGTTVFINCSVCDINYKAVNSPIIIDIPIICRDIS